MEDGVRVSQVDRRDADGVEREQVGQAANEAGPG
jgi:hypothetical protein